MNKTRVSILKYVLSTAAIVVAATSIALAATPRPIQWTLSATTHASLPLRKGATAVAHLHASIQPGWHLYALDQEPGGPTATRISVSDGQLFALNGNIDEPPPSTALDPNFNLETHFYEGETTFTIPLKVVRAAKGHMSKVSVDVLYQTCNDTMCLPPTVAHVSSAIQR
jgi:thiol:disulfide interchange protein DsbD